MVNMENPKIDEILEEVEQILSGSRRVTKYEKGKNRLGNGRLIVFAHEVEFLLEIDDYRQFIRIYRRVDEPTRKYEFVDALDIASSICYCLFVW